MRAWPELLVLALYSLLAWLVVFGRSLALTDRSFGGGLEHDAGTYVWYLWHVKEALCGRADLLHSDLLFYPVGMNMLRQDWAPVAGLLALPFAGLGPLAAYNLQVWLSFVLCGLAAYLLARRLSGSRPWAFLAGLIFAFCEFRMLKALYHGHLSHANQQFLPLFALFCLLYLRSGRIRWAVAAGLGFFLATFCSPYQGVFALLFVLLLVGYWLVRAAVRAIGPPTASRPGELATAARRCALLGLLAGGTAAALAAPLVLASSWQVLVQGDASMSPYLPELGADLLSYVVPTLSHLGTAAQPPFSGEGGCAYLGYTVLALLAASCVGLRWRTGAGLWILLAGIFFVLSLGSVLVVGGQPMGRLPFYALLEQIPFLRGARVAARFSSMVTLGAAVAAAITLARLEQRRLAHLGPARRWLLRGAVIGAVGLELLSFRVGQTLSGRAEPAPFEVPRFYRTLAAEPGELSLLEWPLIWESAAGNIGPLHFPRQHYYLQTLHRKRLITGFGDAVPETTLAYFRRLPFLSDLVRIEAGEATPASTGPGERRQARLVADLLSVRYIRISRRAVARSQVRAERRAEQAIAYIRQALDTAVVSQTPEALVLRVLPEEQGEKRAGPAGPAVELKEPASLVLLGSAWTRTETARGWVAETMPRGREEELLLVQLPSVSPDRGKGSRTAASPSPSLSLSMSLRCTGGPCGLGVLLEGTELGQVQAGAGRWSEVRLAVPPSLAGGLSCRPGRLVPLLLRPLPASDDEAHEVAVGRTGATTAARVVVESRGLRAGDRARIVLEGRDLVPGTRGYNVAVIDPRSRRELLSEAFDLVADRTGAEARRLARLLVAVPEGLLVAVAVRDDGSMGLTGEVVSALHGVGAAQDLRGQMRASYALLGVRGAAPGTAPEQLARKGPAVLRVGSLLQVRRLSLSFAPVDTAR